MGINNEDIPERSAARMPKEDPTWGEVSAFLESLDTAYPVESVAAFERRHVAALARESRLIQGEQKLGNRRTMKDLFKFRTHRALIGTVVAALIALTAGVGVASALGVNPLSHLAPAPAVDPTVAPVPAVSPESAPEPTVEPIDDEADDQADDNDSPKETPKATPTKSHDSDEADEATQEADDQGDDDSDDSSKAGDDDSDQGEDAHGDSDDGDHSGDTGDDHGDDDGGEDEPSDD